MKHRTAVMVSSATTVNFADIPAASVRRLMRDIGSVVYAVRVGDMIKIGFTSNLDQRMRRLGVKPDEILAWRKGTLDDEHALHDLLAGNALEGREWYAANDEVLAIVNEMRSDLGLPILPR